jgi:tetratricopeptide (TPR) repeat protein
VGEETTEETAEILALREAVEAAKSSRPNEYVKALTELGEALPSGPERVALFIEAGELYTEKFRNQAEAIKAYESVLEVDPTHPQAVEFLRDSYEKRRDWEKLIALKKSEAEQAAPDGRLVIYKDIAQLASDRIKRPEICIELWSIVLEADPNDLDALRALSQLFERDRKYEELVDVLERLVKFEDDIEEKTKLLQKLGQVAGDRLKDDARAAEAYRELLVYAPDDRRYQEQLKKRYVALGKWDELEVFYAQSDRWDEFIRVLESNESRAKDDQERIDMLLKVAELWMTQKGKPDRAARAYEKILSLDATNAHAADRLIPIYENLNNAKGLTAAIEVKLTHVTEPAERLALLRRAAELHGARGGDKQKAFECLLAAFELFPDDPQSQEEVEASAREVERWPDMVAAYQTVIQAGAADTLTLRLRLGRVLVGELGDLDGALAQYRAVCDAEPENETALEALEGLYQQAGRGDELLEVYQRRAELAVDPEQRKAILFQIARLYDSQLEQPEQAVATFEEVLTEDPTDERALAALDALYQKTGQWEAFAEILLRRIELVTGEDSLLDLKFRLAQAQEAHLGEQRSALENHREILFINQEHQGSRAALEKMLEGGLQADAAAILESIYETSAQWEKLLGVLEILVQTALETSQQVELLRRISLTAATQVGDVKRAFDAQARAVRVDPARDEVREELENFARLADAWDDLETLYSSIADELADAELAREYWVRLATIQEQRGEVDEAATSYERILELDAGDAEALAAMDALFRGAERWKDLVAVYRKRIDLVLDETEKEGLYAEMAGVFETQLGQPEKAIAAYREVLAFSPASPVALGALDQLYAAQGNWVDLAENLESRLTLAESDEEQLEIMLRLAALREEHMPDAHVAIEGYRQVLDRDPSNQPALAALERLGRDPDNELAIAEILEPLYRNQGNAEKLIAVYAVQERREQDGARKVELLHHVATLYEDMLGDASLAFDTYCRALGVDPTNELTVASLDRLARTTGRFEDCAAQFQALAAEREADDHEVASQLYVAAARVVENELRDIEKAIELYRKVISIDPVNLEAAESLQALFQATSQYNETSLILQRKAEMLDSLDAQKDALYQAATIERDIQEQPEKAIAVYQKVLELDEEDQRAIDALIDLYLGMDRWQDLLAIQAKKADLALDPEDKKVIYYQMGSVYERELRDLAKAIDTYQRVLELDPDDIEALGRLDALHVASENWNELLSVLTQEAELTSDAGEALSYQYRIAELYEKRLDDVVRAVELYQEILNIQAAHAPTLAALENIKSGSVNPMGAALVLEPIYEVMGEFEKLIGALEVQAVNTEEAFAKVELLQRMAQLAEEQLMDHERAFELYALAVSFDTANEESLSSLERLGMALGKWAEIAQLYSDELAHVEDEEERVQLGMRVAQIYEVQLEDMDNAVARYRAVLELVSDNHAALGALDRVFSMTERWADLVGVLERQAEVAETPEEILDFKYRVGQVRQQQLEDLNGAISAYSEVLSAAPEHQEAREALEALFDAGVKQLEIGATLEPLYQAAGEWENLGQVHRAQLVHTEDPEQRLGLFYRIAEDAEEHLMDSEAAFEVYSQALAEHPADDKVGEEIERLAAFIDDGWNRLAVHYADTVSQEGVSPAVQARLGGRLARVYEEELGDPDKAKQSYQFVLSVAPADLGALENLDRIHSSFEEWVDLAEILERRAQAIEDTDDRVVLLSRLGEVYEDRLAQLDDAERAYRQIFDDLEPANEGGIRALERIFGQKESWTDLMRVYERQLEAAVGDVEEAEVRAKIARLSWQKLGQLEAASEGWKRVLELRGDDVEALNGLADLYEHQERWAELSDLLERQFDVADTDEDRVMTLGRRAKLFSQRLGRDDEALETWQRVLDIDYSNPDALLAIADTWRRRADARELVMALHNAVDRAAALLEPAQLTAIHRELGKTYGEVLDQPFEAAEAWAHLLEVEAGDFEAMDELEKLYRAEARLEDVVRVKLQRAAALEEPEEKVRELLEVTDLWRSELEHYDGAAEAFSKILEVEPMHEVAFDELEKLHRSANRWEQLIEVYLGRLEHVEEQSVRSDLWRRMARVFEERLEDEDSNEQAFVALDQAFKEDFHDDATADYLARMAQATGRWKELIADTQELLEQQTEIRDRIKLCLRLGKWYGEDLARGDYANAYYAQVVQMDPGNVQVIRQMANIYRLGGDWKQAAATLHQAEEAAVKNEDRKMVYVDLGDLLRKHMNEADQSVAYYKRALAIDAHLLPALEALEWIYGERSDTGELVQILKRKVEALSDSEGLSHTRLRLAELYEKQLSDPERAASVYAAVVEHDETNLVALRGLERVYTTLQRWTELVDVLEKQLHGVQSERERVEVLMKLARLQEEQFLRAEVAAQRYERAVEIDPAEKAAYEGLERCYRRLKQWDALVRTYERHIEEAEHEDKIRLFGEIGAVYADELHEAEQAISAYQSIVDLDDTNVGALDALAKLYDKRGDVHDSIDCLTKVAELTTDGAQRVDMYYRIGRAQLDRLDDSIGARDSLEKALDLDPAHLQALGALKTIALGDEDWDAASRLLEQEVVYTQSERAKAKLLVELGRIRDERLGEHEAALEAYEQAVQNDSECEEAALPLLESYVLKEKWQQAEPLAELLVRRGRGGDRTEQHRLGNVLGQVHAALGNDEAALKAYQEAFKLDVTSQVSVRGIAEVSYRLKDWPTALTNYQKVLTALGEDEVSERTDVYYRLGCIKGEQGQVRQAVNNYEKALALNGEHRPTLDSLVALYEEQKDWQQVAEYKRQILDSIADDDQRFELLLDIGNVWSKNADQPRKAIDALEEAQTVRPRDHILLHRLLQLYQAASEWPKMVDTILTISELEDDPEKKARYYFTVAQLYRDKLEDGDRAVEYFNEALDLHPGYLEAFERINKILTQARNWKQLERNYRKMLHRIAGKDKTDLEHQLWYQLGLVYRDRISDREKAIDAFKMASHTNPADLTDRRILSELYEVSEQYDEALEQQRYILEQDPLKLEPYRAIYRLYLYKRAYDEAWCAAAVMAFLRKADAEEQRFFEDYRPQGMLPVKGRLSNDHWTKLLLHPRLDTYVSKILEGVAGAALKAKIAQLGANNKLPDKKYKQDVVTSTITFARTFGWSAQVLGLPMPELYVRNDQPGAIEALPTEPKASEAGRSVLSGFQPPELAFVCGKHLAGYRPELYIRNLFPSQSDLTVMLFAGVLIGAPSTPLPQEIASNVQATAKALSQHMDAQAREYLHKVVKRFISDGAKANIKQWNQAAELTACRAALAVSGDLEIAKKILSAERGSPELSAADKMKDLLVFMVSEEYSAVRAALGIKIPSDG